MLSGLTNVFVDNVSNDERVNAEVSSQVGVAAGTGIDFLTLDDDDANLYNGTPHFDEITTGFAAHSM